MVILIDSDGVQLPPTYRPFASATAKAAAAPLSAGSSLSSSSSDCDDHASFASDDDLESSYSSREVDVAIVSKYVPARAGKFARRLSQCEQLSRRPRLPEPSIDAPSRRLRKVFCQSPSRRSAGGGASHRSSPPAKAVQLHPAGREPLPHAARQWRLFAAALALFFSVVVVGQQRQIASLREELDITNQHRAHLEQTRSNLLSQLYAREQSLEGYKRTHGIMTKANQDMSVVIAKLEKQAAEGVRELSTLREEGMEDRRNARRWEAYEWDVRERSRANVVEKYGDGPHTVELQLRFPSSHSVETVRIELASPDEMPETVDAFLTQVSTGSWDGSAFDLHAGHVLMARSSSPASSSRTESASPVPEYSARHPHDKYTVAFPSSSSTDFYVNLRSNGAHHSPRVETDEDGNESFVEGEPCFGRIVDAASRRAVDRMDALMADGRGGSVTIVSAKIVAGR